MTVEIDHGTNARRSRRGIARGGTTRGSDGHQEIETSGIDEQGPWTGMTGMGVDDQATGIAWTTATMFRDGTISSVEGMTAMAEEEM